MIPLKWTHKCTIIVLIVGQVQETKTRIGMLDNQLGEGFKTSPQEQRQYQHLKTIGLTTQQTIQVIGLQLSTHAPAD